MSKIFVKVKKAYLLLIVLILLETRESIKKKKNFKFQEFF